jgi:hypothetical protein
MKRKLHVTSLLLMSLAIVFAGVGFGAARSGISGGERFVAPDITAASDIPYPVEVAAQGLVTLSMNLSMAGQPPTVQVLRDIPGLTSVASSLVTNWTYTLGKLDGNAAPSTINVQLVFNPANLGGQTLQVPPVAPTPPPNPAGYLPAEVAAASYAVYPVNSVAAGAVVLDVTIDKHGDIKNVGVIRDVPSLTQPAIAAVKSWTINAATFNGKGIASKLVVAFVFRPPVT